MPKKERTMVDRIVTHDITVKKLESWAMVYQCDYGN